MAKDKERSVNPATAALKSQKQAAIKKQRAAVAAQRSEKLARRNPDRLQKQIDELTSLKESSGGKLRPHDQHTLEGLERDVRLIRKARDANPAYANDDTRGGPRDRRNGEKHGNNALGKRRRDFDDTDSGRPPRRRVDGDGDDDSEATDPDVRDIPMPRDTPPPVPRRNRRQQGPEGTRAPPAPAVTTYSAEPQLRNLQKEAVSRFMPAAVAARRKEKNTRMLEPEEANALEEEDRARAHKLLEEQELAFRRELAQGAEGDINGIADEAEKEAEYNTMAEEARKPGRGTSNVEGRLHEAEHSVGVSVGEDMQKIADEAEAEAVHKMIADETRTPTVDEADTAQRRLHQVEIEEVADEDRPGHIPKPVPSAAVVEDEFSWD